MIHLIIITFHSVCQVYTKLSKHLNLKKLVKRRKFEIYKPIDINSYKNAYLIFVNNIALLVSILK